MEAFVIFYSWLLGLIILAMFARNILRKNWDLLSWRNLFLLGFLHFYVLGAYFAAQGDVHTEGDVIPVTTRPWFTLVAGMTLFFFPFMISTAVGIRQAKLASRLPRLQIPLTGPAVIGSVIGLNIVALIFMIPAFNYFGLIAGNLRGQIAGCATGLATYYLIARRFNPAAWVLLAATFGVGFVVSTVGAPSRRMMLGVLMVIPWMFHFAVWRYGRPAANFARAGAFLVAGALAVIIYTPFRDPGGTSGTTFQSHTTVSGRVSQLLEIISNPQIDPKAVKMVMYTDTVPITLYAMANYPTPYNFEPLRGVKWFLLNPIPRFIWSDKPAALGFDMARGFRNAVKNFTIGPGIITHGWIEAGYIGVLYYAIFFGLLCGVVDRALAERATNPFFIATIGSTLGNVIALPRGDTPLFLLQIAGGIVASTLILWCLNLAYGRVWSAFAPLLPPHLRHQPLADEGAPDHNPNETDAAYDGPSPENHGGAPASDEW